jgi:hypothetical protein
MEAMEEKRQLKLQKAREYYRNKKATDEEFVKRHNEEARKRHERMRADPAYVAKCRENSRAQYLSCKEAGTLMTIANYARETLKTTVLKNGKNMQCSII